MIGTLYPRRALIPACVGRQRVWFQHCRIREDILEIALGSDEEDISYRAEQIRPKLERLHAAYPDFSACTKR